HRGVLCLGSFSRMREGLLKRGFNDTMERADSHTHACYRATGGASLHSLDDAIAHTKFMHLSSVPRLRGIEPLPRDKPAAPGCAAVLNQTHAHPRCIHLPRPEPLGHLMWP